MTVCESDSGLCWNLDEETLARAILTFCLNTADALMTALLKGTAFFTQGSGAFVQLLIGRAEYPAAAEIEQLLAAQFVDAVSERLHALIQPTAGEQRQAKRQRGVQRQHQRDARRQRMERTT